MDIRVGQKFKLIKKIGSGSFGDIYQGNNNYLIWFLVADFAICIIIKLPFTSASRHLFSNFLLLPKQNI